jgi:hypothetical protein
VDIKKILDVIDVERTPELAFTQEVVEHHACPDRNAVSELLPALTSVRQSSDELLEQVSKHPQ